MDANTVFESTRGRWRVSLRTVERLDLEYVVPVFEGVTRALYRIREWIGPRRDSRYAFTGQPVRSGPVYDAYVGEWGCRAPFREGSRYPVTYWPSSHR